MSNFRPKISVVIPCYNQAHFLSAAILSVQKQTFPNWECLVVNDGSTDDTREVAAKFVSTDPRVRYLEQPNSGLSVARNKGLDAATGEYIQFQDADDIILSHKFERQLAMLKSTQDLALVYCDYQRGGLEDIYTPDSDAPYLPPIYGDAPFHIQLARHWETRMSISVPCFLFDARIFSEYRIRFDTNLRNHEDWDCWIRIAALPLETLFCDDVLVIYRFNPASMSRSNKPMCSGFLCAIDKQIRIYHDNPDMLKILKEKRLETKRYYFSRKWYVQIIARAGRIVRRAAKRTLPFRMQTLIRSALGRISS